MARRKIRWPRVLFLIVLTVIIGGFAHYTLPQRDIVRITNVETQIQRVDGWNSIFYAQGDVGNAVSAERDIRFIFTVFPDDVEFVYRNEDTGFGWPPYFKLSSQDLQARAANLISTRTEPVWVAITHYGWRANLFSAYPNAIRIVEVEGPDVRLFPWLNIAILLGLAAFLFFLWRVWERFEARVLAPASDAIAVRWAKAKDSLSGRR